jgi:IS1 family transposase
MNRLSIEDRAQIMSLLVKWSSLHSITRITGKSINTITKLLTDVGSACLIYQTETLRNLNCNRVQCDEIWSFCGMKQKNAPENQTSDEWVGDVYTYTAICADTKLCASFLVGQRNVECTQAFISDLAGRLAGRIQLTTDGYQPYIDAVELGLGASVDFAMLVKNYSNPSAQMSAERRYSPSEFMRADKRRITGDPDLKQVSTSYVERQNLTMRMSMRRFTRLTNGFSKKIYNLECAVALHFMHYNFGRIHKTLRVAPAMEAGISDHVWSLEEIAKLAD